MVAGAVGELLDHGLVDHHPARQAEFLACHLQQLREGRRRLCHAIAPCPAPFDAPGMVISNLEGNRSLEKRCGRKVRNRTVRPG
jgi:hypothetical protein